MSAKPIHIVRSFLSRLKSKLGDLWWYSLLFFLAQRFGDAVNLFVGLWIVPKYVSQAELGAVLPLTAFVGFIGIPLAIFPTTFQKFVMVFSGRGEYGRMKAFIRDVFIGTAILALLTFLIAYLILPLVFERIRVPAGTLGILMVAVCILSAISSIFTSAVPGIGNYGFAAWYQGLSGPFRLVLMLIFMPIRPLSGYFVGQGAGPSLGIMGSLYVLRKWWRETKEQCQPYWHEYGPAMIRYTIPIAVWTIAGTVGGSLDSLVIRQRLPDQDSAGYYMVSRFSDIAAYLGGALIVFLFPMVAGGRAKGGKALRMAITSVAGTLVGGAAFAGLILVFGSDLLGLTAIWKAYQSYSGYMFWLTVQTVISSAGNCLVIFLMAQGRFGFLWYAIPLSLGKSVAVYLLTGFGFFAGWVPQSWIQAVATFNPCRLEFLIAAALISQLLLLTGLLLHVLMGRGANGGSRDP